MQITDRHGIRRVIAPQSEILDALADPQRPAAFYADGARVRFAARGMPAAITLPLGAWCRCDDDARHVAKALNNDFGIDQTTAVMLAGEARRGGLDERPAADAPRPRACLMCRRPFPSEGFGERVCGPCKSTERWRDGEHCHAPTYV